MRIIDYYILAKKNHVINHLTNHAICQVMNHVINHVTYHVICQVMNHVINHVTYHVIIWRDLLYDKSRDNTKIKKPLPIHWHLASSNFI